MNLRSILTSPAHSKNFDLALFILRLVVGVAMMVHGYSKIQNPFGWMGEESGTPALFQALAALSEFGGGLAVIIGLLFRIASAGIASTMVVATYMSAVVWGNPFVNPKGSSFELSLVFLAITLVFMTGGAGRFSLDHLIFRKR